MSQVDNVSISLLYLVVEILSLWLILLKFTMCRPSDKSFPSPIVEKYKGDKGVSKGGQAQDVHGSHAPNNKKSEAT